MLGNACGGEASDDAFAATLSGAASALAAPRDGFAVGALDDDAFAVGALRDSAFAAVTPDDAFAAVAPGDAFAAVAPDDAFA